MKKVLNAPNSKEDAEKLVSTAPAVMPTDNQLDFNINYSSNNKPPMKFTKLLIVFALVPLLMAQKCADDAEETNGENQEFTEVHYGKDDTVTKDMAIEDWGMFLKQSQNTIDNAEANIGNLQIRIDEADANQKQPWQEVCDFGNLTLLKLKSRIQKRNKEFENELQNYDRSVYEKNEAFETAFSEELETVNGKLEILFEKIRSGYYK